MNKDFIEYLRHSFNFYHSRANSADDNDICTFFLFFQKIGFDIWNVKYYLMGKIRKNISKHQLLKYLPSMERIKENMSLLEFHQYHIFFFKATSSSSLDF